MQPTSMTPDIINSGIGRLVPVAGFITAAIISIALSPFNYQYSRKIRRYFLFLFLCEYHYKHYYYRNDDNARNNTHDK